MPKVEIDLETPVPPARARAALLDFTDRRPELWPGIEPSLYEVLEVGETSATIKEGSKMPGMMVWAVETYDWSDPDVVTWTVKQSNFCAPGSYVSARFAPGPGGGTRIHVTWNRTPTSFAGRIATVFIVASRGKPIAASFRMGMERVAALT